MKNETKYDWCVEEILPNGDIEELHFSDTLAEALDTARDLENETRIILYMYIGNEADGELFRYYAPLVGGRLSQVFDDTDIKVPFKFHNEVKQAGI